MKDRTGRDLGRWRYALLALAAAAALSAGAMSSGTVATASGVQLLDPDTCPDGNVCFWSGTNYTGARVIRSNTAAGWHPIDIVNGAPSAKNRFGNRKVSLQLVAGTTCLQPSGMQGDQSPMLPGVAVYYNVGQPGSRC